MDNVYRTAHELAAARTPFALATVVYTRGSTPQKPGAKLIVEADGSAIGTLGGGCVEADVRTEARKMLAEARGAEVRRFRLTEDIAYRDGLVCGGNMEILIDPVHEPADVVHLLEEIVSALEGGGDRAIAFAYAAGESDNSRDRTSDDSCAKSFIRPDGESTGSLEPPKLDDEIRTRARALMPRGGIESVRTDDGRRVYVETFTTPATIVIAGGGHVGKAIYTFATLLGFQTIVIDDRESFASATRFPEARVIHDDFVAAIRGLSLGPNHAVIVATRGHKLDDVTLLEAARSGAGYVGLLGSRRKAMMILRDLHLAGIPDERLRDIRAPVGLDLGGRRPDEIALSIVSEIVALRNARTGGTMSMVDDEILAKVKSLAERAP